MATVDIVTCIVMGIAFMLVLVPSYVGSWVELRKAGKKLWHRR